MLHFAAGSRAAMGEKACRVIFFRIIILNDDRVLRRASLILAFCWSIVVVVVQNYWMVGRMDNSHFCEDDDDDDVWRWFSACVCVLLRYPRGISHPFYLQYLSAMKSVTVFIKTSLVVGSPSPKGANRCLQTNRSHADDCETSGGKLSSFLANFNIDLRLFLRLAPALFQTQFSTAKRAGAGGAMMK